MALRLGIAVVIALVTLGIAGAIVTRQSETNESAVAVPASSDASSPLTSRTNSHILQPDADGSVTLVEFLDFECESCRAVYPFIESLRKTYAGKVRFIARYFPIPSHANAVNAALAVEAAAQQGQFEAMYSRMYETQEQWGEQEESKASLFRDFAQAIGLDLQRYDGAIADPSTLARIELDRQEGLALGVDGTPSFFLNGERIRPQSEQEFQSLIDGQLAARP
ncbi:MAG: thioredoxin domain-containing protein [Actinomycetota bacterium]|nr:thioredoxin domain-containing protein [Actinomycetota bacterium]MDP2289523.1 thioredoxin domain-containing protein [Actinomycetota bacterium]